MAVAENTVKVFNWIKEHNADKPTAADVANGTGLTEKQVQGAFLYLANNGLGHRETKPGTKIDTVKFVEITEDGKTYDGELSEMGVAVLDYLKNHAEEKLTYKDIAEALNVDGRKVNGTITALSKEIDKTGRPALARRVEAKIEVPADVKYFVIEAGAELTIDAE